MKRPQAQADLLNDRETFALTWSARGMTSQEIARLLGTSKRNIDFFLDTARTKLGAATRIQAVALAIRKGLIEP